MYDNSNNLSIFLSLENTLQNISYTSANKIQYRPIYYCELSSWLLNVFSKELFDLFLMYC